MHAVTRVADCASAAHTSCSAKQTAAWVPSPMAGLFIHPAGCSVQATQLVHPTSWSNKGLSLQGQQCGWDLAVRCMIISSMRMRWGHCLQTSFKHSQHAYTCKQWHPNSNHVIHHPVCCEVAHAGCRAHPGDILFQNAYKSHCAMLRWHHFTVPGWQDGSGLTCQIHLPPGIQACLPPHCPLQ